MKEVKILHKRGVSAPDLDDIDIGEVAVNTLAGKLYVKTDGDDIVEIGSGDGGTGAGMVISATEPVDPADGMQWMDATTAIVWVWDEDKWLEFPAGKGGDSGGTYTLPVSVRGGDIQLPLNEDSTKLIVDTRSGPVELPLMAA